jgi:hypothetical protein
MPPTLFFLSPGQLEVLLKMRTAPIRAWLYAAGFLASRISLVTSATQANTNDYLLGLGRFIFSCSTIGPVILSPNGTYRNCGYHRVRLNLYRHSAFTEWYLSWSFQTRCGDQYDGSSLFLISPFMLSGFFLFTFMISDVRVIGEDNLRHWIIST